METRTIGSLSVSAVGLGCNNFGSRLDSAATAEVVAAALDSGITFFDTADIYANGLSEEYLGAALGARRTDVVLATKFGMELDAKHRGAHPDYIRAACADSLRRLGTDYIDLYWLHQPDPAVPIADTLGALSELVTAGHVRQIGCSNFTAAQLREADAEARRLGGNRFVALQNELSLLHREPLLPEPTDAAPTDPPFPNDGHSKRGVLAECQSRGLAFVPYFPLASGMLTGKYRRGAEPPAGTRLSTSARAGRFLNEANLELVEQLMQYAAAHDRSLLELAFGWLLARPSVASVIAGATSAEQVRANTAAAGWHLSSAELAEIDGLLPRA